jgi:hypothetical protein
MSEQKRKKEFGDFQTPFELAVEVCALLKRSGVQPNSIIEPTCGIGNFARASGLTWPEAKAIRGFDVNAEYVQQARENAGAANADFEVADFFRHDWTGLLATLSQPILIVGNLPWVTSSEIGVLGGANLPTKSNFAGMSGFDAISGKANFDISEWMLLQMLEWCERSGVTVALLVKLSVARKVLLRAWAKNKKIGHSAIHRIEAKRWFGAAVDACLFVFSSSAGPETTCPVYETLGGRLTTIIGIRDKELVGDVRRYDEVSDLLGGSRLRWRSGVKHDCSKVMEFSRGAEGLMNGHGKMVDLESEYLFPLFKSSQLARGDTVTDRLMLLTQRQVGAPTNEIRELAPKTWDYLVAHSDELDPRASTIYQKGPRFSIFGVGDYTFAPFKVAISGLYKIPRFVVLTPIAGKPCVVDDTACFLSFTRHEDAVTVANALNTERARAFMSVFAFVDAKRPYTVDVLSKLNLVTLLKQTGYGELAILEPETDGQELLSFNAV